MRVYSLSLYLNRPTSKQQLNARAPLATQGENSLGAQLAPRRSGVGIVHLEVNSDPQYNGALSVPMRLPRLPVTTIAELKSHFKHLSSQTISLGWGDAIRHQEVRRRKSFWVSITLRQWSPQVKAATTCYYCNQSAPAYTWQRTSKRQENHHALLRHKQYGPKKKQIAKRFCEGL